MSQSIVNEVLAKKPKRRVEWVQKRLKEDLAITHRDSLYEVLVRKEGRAFAADISGADAVRTYNAVLAAIELFTTKQQRHLQADTFLLRKIHSQEQERHKAAQAKAKAAVKKPAKDRPSPSGLLQRPTAQKESPKMAQRPQSPDESLPSARDPTFSPPRNSVPKERPRSASPDWIPRTPPQEPPQEPRKATGSWTTIFQSPPEDQEKQEKLSPPRTEAVTRHQGAKEETETKDSKPAKRDRDSSSSTEYDAFATGPEPVALQSPPRTRRKQSHESHKSRRSRQSESSTGSADESVARPSGLVAQSVRPGSSGSPSLERKPTIDRKEVEIETSHNGNVSSTDKTRLPNAASATLHAQGGEGPDLPARTEKSPEVSKGESDNLPPECNGSGSDSDSDSSSSADDGKIEPAGAVPEEQKDLDEGSDSDDSESSEHEEQEDRAPEVPEVPPEVPEVPEVQSILDGMTTEAAPDPVGKTPLPRRPPPPPPPPARRRMAEADAFPRWRYIAPDGQERLAIRSSPGVDAPTTGGSLGSGEVFAVKEESPGANGVLFLRLADGRGWVFDRRSGLARRRRTRPLCVPYQVPLVDEEDLGKAKRSRPKAVGLPKAKRRRRRQAVIDPYMVTADIIQVDSDEDARLANPAAKASESDNTGNPPREAKENLRLQLEKKQREVQALRAKLSQLDAQKEPSRSQRLASADPKQVQGAGRWHKAEATDQMLDEKRRELQAMLAKKRAMSAARLQKTAPRYVD